MVGTKDQDVYIKYKVKVVGTEDQGVDITYNLKVVGKTSRKCGHTIQGESDTVEPPLGFRGGLGFRVYFTVWLFSAVIVFPALFCDLSCLESGNPPVLPSRYGLCSGHRAFEGGALMAQTGMVLMTNLKKNIELMTRDSGRLRGCLSYLASRQRTAVVYGPPVQQEIENGGR